MLLRVLAGEPGVTYDWLRVGGHARARSYGLGDHDLRTQDEAWTAPRLRAAMPDAHVALLPAFETSVRFGDYLLVHAGIRPGTPIEAQDPTDLRWIGRPLLADPRDHGVMVIHGHSISDGVDRRPNRIGIDTGAYRIDILTAAAAAGRSATRRRPRAGWRGHRRFC